MYRPSAAQVQLYKRSHAKNYRDYKPELFHMKPEFPEMWDGQLGPIIFVKHRIDATLRDVLLFFTQHCTT